MRLLAIIGLSTCLFWLAPLSAQANSRVEPVNRDHFIYYFHNPEYVEIADNVLDGARNRLTQLFGDTLDYRPSIYIVDDLNQFNELIGGRFPDWGAAAAFPERKLIAIKSPQRFNINRSLEELLAHEYAHLVTAHSVGLYSPPRWFDEGVSMYVSMEWSWSDNLAMSKAAVFGQIIDLGEIDNVNRFGEGKAHVAYAESYLAIRYLIDTYGVESVGRLVNELAKGASVSQALLTVTGATEKEFEGDFRLHLNRRFNVVSLFMDTIFFWLGLSLLVVIGGWLKFRKRRRYYREWEKREELESTDFDYGDPDNPEQTDDDGDEPWRA